MHLQPACSPRQTVARAESQCAPPWCLGFAAQIHIDVVAFCQTLPAKHRGSSRCHSTKLVGLDDSGDAAISHLMHRSLWMRGTCSHILKCSKTGINSNGRHALTLEGSWLHAAAIAMAAFAAAVVCRAAQYGIGSLAHIWKLTKTGNLHEDNDCRWCFPTSFVKGGRVIRRMRPDWRSL